MTAQRKGSPIQQQKKIRDRDLLDELDLQETDELHINSEEDVPKNLHRPMFPFSNKDCRAAFKRE